MIRQAQPADIRRAAQLLQMHWFRHSLEQVEQQLYTRLKREGDVLFLAMDGDRVVGAAACHLMGKNDVQEVSHTPVACLDALYVIEEERGMGHGTQLLSQCEEWAREHHCLELSCSCNLSDTQSVIFFLKHQLYEAGRSIHLIKTL